MHPKKPLLLFALIVIIYSFGMIAALDCVAGASSLCDTSQPLSLRVSIRSNQKSYANVLLELYHVADMSTTSGNYSLTSEFAESVLRLCEVDNAYNAQQDLAKISEFIARGSVSFKTQATNESGLALFENLSPGVYYVKQQFTLDNTTYRLEIVPFFATVPQSDSKTWSYSVTAYPKVEHLPLIGSFPSTKEDSDFQKPLIPHSWAPPKTGNELHLLGAFTVVLISLVIVASGLIFLKARN